jgi:hypothetical protein
VNAISTEKIYFSLGEVALGCVVSCGCSGGDLEDFIQTQSEILCWRPTGKIIKPTVGRENRRSASPKIFLVNQHGRIINAGIRFPKFNFFFNLLSLVFARCLISPTLLANAARPSDRSVKQ